MIRRIKRLEMKEAEAQDIYKISYYYQPEHYDEDELRTVFGTDLSQVTLVHSHQKFLDVLPVHASKGHAIRYLSQKWAIPLANVIACGDSGNDMDMFRKPIKGIIVGGRSKELDFLKADEFLYLADEKAAKGVVEGLKHYGYL